MLLIVLALASFLAAILIFGMNTGYYESNISYGGDAYTGIQNAAAQTANNITYMAEILRGSFGTLFALLGGGLLSTGLCINTKKRS